MAKQNDKTTNKGRIYRKLNIEQHEPDTNRG